MVDPKPDLPSYFPQDTLLNPRIIWSIIGQVLITALSIIGLYFWLKGQGFYVAADKNSDIKSDEEEVTAILTFTLPLYISVGIIFYFTSKFKESIFLNISWKYLFLIVCFILQVGLVYWIMLGPLTFMKDSLDLVHLDFYFRVIMAGSSIGISILYILYELALNKVLDRFKF